MRSFEDLVGEAEAADVSGWDFSWLAGRATEERPWWGYQRLMSRRLSRVSVALDIQTGGGEVLSEAPVLPDRMFATESWPPNVLRARELLEPRGVVVVEDRDEPPLPFDDSVFELVTSRHPVQTYWSEIARVLAPGGTYVAQQVGPGSAVELIERLLGPQPEAGSWRRPEQARSSAESAGLEVVNLQEARLRMAFFDIGAVVYVLRKVIWWVPDFSVDRYVDALREIHARIVADGAFVAHSSRFLIEAHKAGPLRRGGVGGPGAGRLR